MAHAQEAIQPGTMFAGRYRALGQLGKGGMGTVVLAQDVQTGQRVAVKCLLPSHCEDFRLVARFRREARATIRLRSEHVAHVFDAGEHEGAGSSPPIPFLVMEYLEGQDLRSIMRDTGRIPFQQAADYVVQACAGLAEAHALGIVHRDLKPANLFLASSSGGRRILKILDFGVAKFESPSTSGDEEHMTRAGETVGSVSYMAPEQLIDASTVDARADIWSLGVLLYHLVSGERPFDGDSVRDVAINIVMGAHRPLEEARPDLPAALINVVHRCLGKDREHRPGSVVELARILAPFTVQRTRSVPEAQMFQRTARLSGDLVADLRAAALGEGDTAPPFRLG